MSQAGVTPEAEKPKLSDLTVSLAFQLNAFSANNVDLYEKNINALYHQVILSIVDTYDPPADVLRGSEPHVRRGRSNSRALSVDPSEVDAKEDPFTFPLAWKHPSSLAEASATFIKGVRFYRDSEYFEVWKVDQTEDADELPSPWISRAARGKARQYSSTSRSSPVLSPSVSLSASPSASRRFLPPGKTYTADDIVRRVLFPNGSTTMPTGGNDGGQSSSSGGPGFGNFNQRGGQPPFPPQQRGAPQNPGNQQPGTGEMPQAPPGVDAALYNAMIQAIRATVPEAVNNTLASYNLHEFRGPAGPPGPPGPTGEPGEAGQSNQSGGGAFRAHELGFFHPDCPESWGTGDIVPNPRELIFREVYTFCSRAQDFAVMKGEEVVRRNLNSCFRGAAANWWLKILSQDEKDAMMQLPTGLQRQIARLQDHFKITMSTALEELSRQSYTSRDASERNDPSVYVQNVSKYAVQAGITEEHAQATWAWNHLDVEFQATIPPPTTNTTLREFIEQLKSRKEMWHRMQSQKEQQHKDTRKEIREREKDRDNQQERSSKEKFLPPGRQGGYSSLPYRPQQYQQQQYQQRPFQQNRPMMMGGFPPQYGYQQQGQPFYSNPFQAPYTQPAYIANTQTTQPPQQASSQAAGQNQPPRNALPPPKQPLMITAGNAQPNQNPYSASRQNQNYGNRGGRPYYPPRQYGYGNRSYGNQNYGPPALPIQPVYFGQEVYFNDSQNENYGYEADRSPEGYFAGPEYNPQDPYAYHAGTDENFHDAQESVPPEEKKEQEDIDVGFVAVSYHVSTGKMGHRSVCRHCKADFPSNNLLHAHVKAKTCRRTKASAKKSIDPIPAKEAPASSIEPLLLPTKVVNKGDVIESAAPRSSLNGLSFRSWHYLTGQIALSLNAPREPGCLDTGCPMTMIDRAFLKRRIPTFEMKVHESPITLRGIGSNRHATTEWTTLGFYMDGESEAGDSVTIKITRDFHIVDNLKANMLIGMDVLGPEQVTIDLPRNRVIFGSCNNVSVPVQTTARDNVRIRRVVRSERRQEVPPQSTAQVAVTVGGKAQLPDRDFLFEPHTAGVYAHFIDSRVDFVNVRNEKNTPLIISRRQRMGSVVEYEAEETYPIDLDNHSLAAKTTCGEESIASELTKMLDPRPAITRTHIDPTMETKLANGITIYGKMEDVSAIQKLTEEHPRIWEDTGDTIDLPESEWLTVPVTTNWQSSDAKLGNKVYPLSPDARALVDEKFDKMHEQGKISWSTQPSPFAFPVFVVWKTVYEGPEKTPRRKGRVVVDIRGLNKITVSDNYPLPLQSDIVSSVQGCTQISVVDCSGQFHLFLVKKEDRHKFTVVSHRGAEHYNVAAMGFKGSVPYVQRKMDDFLRPYRHFARCYVDDIVIFSRSINEHLQHLKIIFSLFASLKITLEPKKSYLAYPSVTLLGQKVDGFGMTTTAERVAAIKDIRFPDTLQALETYIGMANWLRSNIKYFAQIAEPLQRRKTELLKGSPAKGGHIRKAYSRNARFVPTEEELNSFEMLQKALTSETYLHHRDPSRQLYIDIDASKKYGIGVMVYHVKEDPQGNSFPRADVQPILFLSKLLNPAEARYWPTELEVAGLIWTLKKIPHLLVQVPMKKVIIFTDHSATTDIARQTTLSSSSSDRMNLRLVRASQYASQYDLDVRWRPGKQNIVPDALSRLLRKKEGKVESESQGVLDEVFIFNMVLTEMSEDYRRRLGKAYTEDKKWSKIVAVLLEEKNKLEKDSEGVKGDVIVPNIQFFLRDNLIYYKDEYDDRERLCIPKSMEREVFDLAHDKRSHGGFHRTYEQIVGSYYMRHLTRRLKRYIQHCPDCQLNQTKRHAPYGEMKPIITPPRVFYTITIDFILALPVLPNGHNTMLTVTDKFSKRVTTVSGKDTWTAEEWAVGLLAALADWGIPNAIISDRDPKFLSGLWKAIFKALGTELMVSTAYHPQSDGQSERTNQTVEIALRFHIACFPDKPWDEFAVTLRSVLNNSSNASTTLSPNEIVYGMKLNDGTSVAVSTSKNQTDVTDARSTNRKEAADAIAFATAESKIRYDSKHVPLLMEEGDMVFLKLHNGYRLPGLDNKKLSNQRAGPFKILKRYGRLAYKLDLPESMTIHPVVSVAALEPAPLGEDPYKRPRETGQGPVFDNDDEGTNDHYEIERLLDRRERRLPGRGKRIVTEYLVKWKGWGPVWNKWYGIDDLADARELIEEYEEKYGPQSVRGHRIESRKESKGKRQQSAAQTKS